MGPGYTTWVFPSTKEKVKKKKRHAGLPEVCDDPLPVFTKKGLSPTHQGYSRKEGNRLIEFGTLQINVVSKNVRNYCCN